VSAKIDAGSGAEPAGSHSRSIAAVRRLIQNDQLSLLFLAVLIGSRRPIARSGFASSI